MEVYKNHAIALGTYLKYYRRRFDFPDPSTGNLELVFFMIERLSPNRSREGTAQINCVSVCVSVRHHLNAYISETN